MTNIRIAFFALALVLFCSFSAFAELVLSGFEKEGDNFSITFNGSIRISGVSLANDKILLPEYAKNGKIYRNFSILQRDFAKKIYENIKSNKTSAQYSKINYKINKFKLISSHKTIKAFSSVIFEEKLEAECRVIEGKYGLWIAWPSEKKGGVWIKNFIIIDKDLKNNIEDDLIKRYNSNI